MNQTLKYRTANCHHLFGEVTIDNSISMGNNACFTSENTLSTEYQHNSFYSNITGMLYGRTGEHSGTVSMHSNVTGEHSGEMGEHSGTISMHSNLTGEHSGSTGEYSRVTGEHSRSTGAYSDTTVEHSRRMGIRSSKMSFYSNQTGIYSHGIVTDPRGNSDIPDAIVLHPGLIPPHRNQIRWINDVYLLRDKAFIFGYKAIAFVRNLFRKWYNGFPNEKELFCQRSNASAVGRNCIVIDN